MSQVFGAVANSSDAGGPLVAGVATRVIDSGPLVVPYQTAKAKVNFTISVQLGAAATSLTIVLVRNDDAESLLLAIFPFTITAGVIGSAAFTASAVDSIPDPRDCVYSAYVKSDGDDSSINFVYIEATLLSG